MSAGRVLMTDNIFKSLDEFHEVLDPLGLRLEVAPTSDEQTLARLAVSAVALIVVYAKITQPVIAAAAQSGCRVISRCGIGYDNIDVDAATRHGIQVTFVPDYCIDEVADHTIALLLAAARSVIPAVTSTRGGGWTASYADVHRIRGRRLALIGVGRIGRAVATRALSLGLLVTAYDPYVDPWNLPEVTRSPSIEEAVVEADFISLHLPLTTATTHLINHKTLALMKRRPVLINTARGGLVDLTAVSNALSESRLAGVALDVFESEPLPENHPLRSNPGAVITPHMAYYSIEAEIELKRRAAEEVARAIRLEPPRCPVNRPEMRRVD